MGDRNLLCKDPVGANGNAVLIWRRMWLLRRAFGPDVLARPAPAVGGRPCADPCVVAAERTVDTVYTDRRAEEQTMTIDELRPSGLTATYEPVDWSPADLPEDPDEVTDELMESPDAVNDSRVADQAFNHGDGTFYGV